jgi:hypothetical protein
VKTHCQKCIFADFYDSEIPCALGVVDIIKNDKSISQDSNSFNIIDKYRCAYGFDLKVYEANKEKIGSIEDLKNALKERATISYYMIVFLDSLVIDKVCEKILGLPILPKFVSFVTYQDNETDKIISTCKKLLNTKVGWKLHNMLEILTYQESLDIVLDTNTHTKSSAYLWINSSNNIDMWEENIKKINYIVTLQQPECHALLRNNTDKDGLFMSFKNYDEIRHSISPNIFEAFQNIPNPTIINYA